MHLVGHSLGGLLSADLLREGDLAILRVVQLGSPNLGSAVAERLGGTWPLRHLCGPALEDLAALDDTPPVHAGIAAIAGTIGPDLPGDTERPHDGAVSQRSAWAGARHRAAIPQIHTLLPASRAAATLTAHFLKNGRFPEEP